MKTLYLTLFIFGMCMVNTLHASGPTKVQQLINHKEWRFVENKGQLTDENGYPIKEIKYYGNEGGVNLYCKPGRISFVFTKIDHEPAHISEATGSDVFPRSPSKYTTSRTDLIFSGSDLSAQIVASDQQEYFENFYTGYTNESGITNVHTYMTITYKNIYPHIDMILHAKNRGMKYEFIVYPGGKVGDIRMQWNGLKKIEMTENGGIKYASDIASYNENHPFSYLIKGGFVNSEFQKKTNIISFKVPKYNKSETLVIDPWLNWGTFLGDSGSDIINGIVTDTGGYVYAIGSTNSTKGIATSGAYQTSYSGGSTNYTSGDVLLTAFDSKGKRKWGTYYGGNDQDQGRAIAIDQKGFLYLTGFTQSTSGMTTSGAYQTSLYKYSDAFIAKFNRNGQRQWASYLGGDGADFGSGIVCDRADNIYVTGYTSSQYGLATKNTYMSANFGGAYDFIAKFKNSGSIVWATFYGGGSEDVIQLPKIAADPKGNIFITGCTASVSGIATSGAYQTKNGGYSDAFIAKFSSDDSLLWASYLGGSVNDGGTGIATDPDGNAYIVGFTNSKSGIYYGHGNYFPDQSFYAKFSGLGKISWSSYITGQGEVTSAIAIDTLYNLYLAITANYQQITPDAYQDQTNSGRRLYFGKYDTSGYFNYASFFGGNHDESATCLAYDRFGNVFIGGHTTSTNTLPSKGAFQTTNIDSNSAFLAKFSFPYNDAGLVLPNNNTSFCIGNQPVYVYLKNFGYNELDSVLINWNLNNKPQTPYYWKGKVPYFDTLKVNIGTYNFSAGNYIIKAWTSRPNGILDSIALNDTIFETEYYNDLPAANTGGNKQICYGQSDSIGAAAVIGHTYDWASSPAGFASNSGKTVITPKKTTTYYLTETNTSTGCSKTDSVIITVKPLPAVHFSLNYFGKTTYLHASDSSLIDASYNWAFGDGDSAGGHLAKHLYQKNKSYIVSLLVKGSNGCENKLDSSVAITVSGINLAEINGFGLSVFPNPFGDATTATYTLDKNASVKITLVDITGKQIGLIKDEKQGAGKYSVEINTAKYNLEAGIYFVKFAIDGEIMTRQVVKMGY